MPDPRFFAAKGPFTLAEVAAVCGVPVPEGADAARLFAGVAPLDEAGPGDVGFFENRRYLDSLAATAAGACLVAPEFAGRLPAGCAGLISPRPRRAYARLARAFHPEDDGEPGIDPRAVVDGSAEIGPGCRIEAAAVVGARARLGAGCRIGSGAVIGEGVVLGDACRVGANAVVSHALVGARTVIYPGALIGQPGFGFDPDPSGHVKVPQLGRVVIGEDCEIGAGSTIDRGSGPDTVIGPGCMIDNLVQIGHNVVLGRGCVIVAQVGISGSTRLGDFVTLAGQVGVAGHVTLGSGVMVAAKSGVHADIPAGTAMGGYPAVPIREWRRQVAWLKLQSGRRGKEQ